MSRFTVLASERLEFQPTVSVASSQWRGLDRLAHPRVKRMEWGKSEDAFATNRAPMDSHAQPIRTMAALIDLCCCERLALWSVRCLIGHVRVPPCRETRTTDGLFPEVFASLLNAAERSFDEAQKRLRTLGRKPLTVASPGTQSLTTLEMSFIEAIRALQNDNREAARTCVRMSLRDGLVQEKVIVALTLIAECMAGAGHWLVQHD